MRAVLRPLAGPQGRKAGRRPGRQAGGRRGWPEAGEDGRSRAERRRRCAEPSRRAPRLAGRRRAEPEGARPGGPARGRGRPHRRTPGRGARDATRSGARAPARPPGLFHRLSHIPSSKFNFICRRSYGARRWAGVPAMPSPSFPACLSFSAPSMSRIEI